VSTDLGGDAFGSIADGARSTRGAWALPDGARRDPPPSTVPHEGEEVLLTVSTRGTDELADAMAGRAGERLGSEARLDGGDAWSVTVCVGAATIPIAKNGGSGPWPSRKPSSAAFMRRAAASRRGRPRAFRASGGLARDTRQHRRAPPGNRNAGRQDHAGQGQDEDPDPDSGGSRRADAVGGERPEAGAHRDRPRDASPRRRRPRTLAGRHLEVPEDRHEDG
jgi:hypothetical protein